MAASRHFVAAPEIASGTANSWVVRRATSSRPSYDGVLGFHTAAVTVHQLFCTGMPVNGAALIALKTTLFATSGGRCRDPERNLFIMPGQRKQVHFLWR